MRSSKSNINLFRATANQPSHISIELLSVKDIQEFIAVSRKTRKETYPAYTEAKLDEMYSDEYRKIVCNELANNSYVYLVMKDNGKMFGFAKLVFENDKIPVLDKFYLTQSHQRQGHGTALLFKCFKTVVARECNKLWLGVYRKNEGAMAFYEKCGFKRLAGETSFVNPTTGEVKTNSDVPMQCDDVGMVLANRYSSWVRVGKK